MKVYGKASLNNVSKFDGVTYTRSYWKFYTVQTVISL